MPKKRMSHGCSNLKLNLKKVEKDIQASEDITSVTPSAKIDENDKSGNDVELSNLVPEFIVNAVSNIFGQISFLIKFKGEGTRLIPFKEANALFPQVAIQYYEKHIQWIQHEENIQASRDEFIVTPSVNTHRDLQVYTTMPVQRMSYTPGSYVWVMLKNKFWWPGKVIDPSLIPNELAPYVKKRKNPIVVVYFERDESYEFVINMKHIFLYSCSNKYEILRKGYLLFEKQKKTGIVVGGFQMEHFIEDVKCIERELNGDINIFDQFIRPQLTPLNIKELFMTDKKRKRREKEKLFKASLEAFKTALKAPKKTSTRRAVNYLKNFQVDVI